MTMMAVPITPIIMVCSGKRQLDDSGSQIDEDVAQATKMMPMVTAASA